MGRYFDLGGGGGGPQFRHWGKDYGLWSLDPGPFLDLQSSKEDWFNNRLPKEANKTFPRAVLDYKGGGEVSQRGWDWLSIGQLLLCLFEGGIIYSWWVTSQYKYTCTLVGRTFAGLGGVLLFWTGNPTILLSLLFLDEHLAFWFLRPGVYMYFYWVHEHVADMYL